MPRHDDYDERFDLLARLAYQVAYRLTGDRHESEDLAQETMTRAYLRWSRMSGHAEAWVVRVTTNLVIGRWRRRRRPDAAVDGAPGSDHGMAERLVLTGALRSLPKRQRQVVVLRFLGDLSIEQTAQSLGCSIGAVKQHSSRAVAALRVHDELRDLVVGIADMPIPAEISADTGTDRPPPRTTHLRPPTVTSSVRSPDVP